MKITSLCCQAIIVKATWYIDIFFYMGSSKPLNPQNLKNYRYNLYHCHESPVKPQKINFCLSKLIVSYQDSLYHSKLTLTWGSFQLLKISSPLQTNLCTMCTTWKDSIILAAFNNNTSVTYYFHTTFTKCNIILLR